MNEAIQRMIMVMFGNNPMFKRAQEMSNGKSEQEVLQVINNLCSQRGVSVDEMYKKCIEEFNKLFGGMNH